MTSKTEERDERLKTAALAVLSGKRVTSVEMDLLACYVLTRELEPGKLLPTIDAAMAERRDRFNAKLDRKLERLGAPRR